MIDSAFGQFMNSVFGGFDYAIFAGFGSVQSPLLNEVAVAVSAFCSEYFLILIAIMGAIMCLFKKYRKAGMVIVLCVLAAVIVGKLIINPVAGRIRPYNALQSNSDYFSWYTAAGMVPESKYTFPSCHTFAAFALATGLFCILKNKKSWQGVMLWVAAILISCSRIYLMVHYPTDVIAGILLGVIFGFLIAKFANVYEKNCKNWPLFNKLDKIDASKWKIFKWANIETDSHDDFSDEQSLSKHKPKHIKTNNQKTSKLNIFVILFLIVSAVSIGLQEYRVHGGIHRCEHRGNDYICMNKGSNKINDSSGSVHYYCDLHESDASK